MPPIEAQPVTWTEAVDAYLDGRFAEAARVLDLPPDEAGRQARQGLDAWMAEARLHGSDGARASEVRRRVLRRVQATAVLPLEVLVRTSSRAPVADRFTPLERVGADAWARLADLEGLRLDGPDDPQWRTRQQARDALDRFRGRWQVALLQLLVNSGRHREAQDLVPRLRLLPGETAAQAEAWLLHGMLQEFAARMADEGTARSAMSTTMPTSRLRGIGARLDEARRLYRRALEAAPSHSEARLRLGRVELERKRPTDAISVLAPLRASPCRTSTCGLAWIFTGEARETLGDWAAAASSYVQASTLQPLRQSALVALIQLALRRDNPAHAFDLTSQFTTASPLAALEQPDAWGEYLSGRRADSEAVLAPLREAIRP